MTKPRPPVDVVPITASMDRAAFSCGKPDLDEWLQRYAGQQERLHNTRTFIAVDRDRGTVVGYYATTAYRMDLD